MVEDDIEAEALAEAEAEESQEEAKEEKQIKPKKNAVIKKPKDEFFDGSDSDEEDKRIQSAYAKPSRGGGQ